MLWLYWQAFNDGLGADPVKYVIHFTGIGALNILLITLSVSPIARAFKHGYLINVRRLLGLYAFFYACLHLTNFIVFDLQMDWPLLLGEIIERPYITVGMLVLVLMLALAITSFTALKKRMGRRWQSLHNSIYVIVLLACTHFIWSVKSDIIEPLIYFFMAFVLLWFRRKKFLSNTSKR